MKKVVWIFFFFALPLLVKAQYTEIVRDNVVVHRNGTEMERLSILIPIPQSNAYQTVHNVDYDGATVCHTEGEADTYARFQFNNVAEDSVVVGVRTVVTHHVINTDFSQIDPNVPYNTSSFEYQLYTGATPDGYVDPHNSTIVHIADSIWNIADDPVNYALHCYDYVAYNYDYLNPYTGIHPLNQILSDGGGDCGNLSSIFISLLRCKGIPARHVVAFFSDGGCHVWAEFKTGGSEWIPVDVTYHRSDPYGNYFGRYNYNAIVVGFDVGHTYSRWNNFDTYTADILQAYHWWWWGYGGETTSQWSVSGEGTDPVAIAVLDTSDMKLYGSNGAIVVEQQQRAAVHNLSVYDIMGRPIVRNMKVLGNKAVIPVPATGVYIVHADRAKPRKIFVLK